MREPRLIFAVLACAAMAALAPATAAAGERGPTIGQTLRALHASGAISDADYRERARTYRSVRSALRRLRGGPRAALRDALDQVDELAAAKRLDGRLVPVFLTLERNLDWYARGRRGVPASGTRETFAGSEVVFQHYGHAGWQIQPLASFGRLNGLLTGRRPRVARARRLADELLGLSVRRAGRLASEYHFGWDGAEPGWVSGMAAGTAVQALARLWHATRERRYLDAAAEMLFVFERPSPVGVRAEESGAGPHFLLYSESPRRLVGNGFAQALVGLHDYASISADPRGGRLYAEGLARARATLPLFDTGAWSLYWRRPGTRRGEESSLHYHRVFTTFLDRLCERTDEAVFCDIAGRFRAYEKEPVRIGRLRTRAGRRSLEVRVWTSKRGSGRLRLLWGEREIRSRPLSLSRGTQVVRWRKPSRGRTFNLRLEAESPTGLDSRAERELRLGR